MQYFPKCPSSMSDRKQLHTNIYIKYDIITINKPAWKRQEVFFRNTLLLCCFVFVSCAKIYPYFNLYCITGQLLDGFYEHVKLEQ